MIKSKKKFACQRKLNPAFINTSELSTRESTLSTWEGQFKM